MRYFYVLFIVLFGAVEISAEETTQQSDAVEYIQELTGKIEILTKAVDDLQKRIEGLESQLNSKACEIKNTDKKDQVTTVLIKEKLKKNTISAGAKPLWSEALSALQQKKFEVAEQKFLDFIHLYPDHTDAPEGQYWLGEIQLFNKKYTQAQTRYALAYKAFPETNVRKADAGLKIAKCYFAMNKTKEGCLFLKEIMKLQQKGAAISTATLQLLQQYWTQYKCETL